MFNSWIWSLFWIILYIIITYKLIKILLNINNNSLTTSEVMKTFRMLVPCSFPFVILFLCWLFQDRNNLHMWFGSYINLLVVIPETPKSWKHVRWHGGDDSYHYATHEPYVWYVYINKYCEIVCYWEKVERLGLGKVTQHAQFSNSLG